MFPQIFLHGEIMTQRFGANPQRYAAYNLLGHEGIDLKPRGFYWGVHAAEGGVVVLDDDFERGPGDPYGIQVRILAPSGRLTIYTHLSENTIYLGQKIRAGDLIGIMGNTGNSDAPHVHFGVAWQLKSGLRRAADNGFGGLEDPEKETWPIWRTA